MPAVNTQLCVTLSQSVLKPDIVTNKVSWASFGLLL